MKNKTNNMKKPIAYLAVAVLTGLLLGWLLFGQSINDGSAVTDVSDRSDGPAQDDAAEPALWTCSMHPQIMQPDPGDCPICGMDLIPAESNADNLSVNEIKMTENAMALANIQTTIVGNVTSGENNNLLKLSGKIVVNEENNAVQSSYFAGRIERLNVNFTGQEVRRGELLATIYAPNLVAAQQELITAASLKETQPALYRAVRNKLKNWKLTDAQINAIESEGKVRENFPVYATVTGTVSEVLVAEGDYVNQGQPIVRLSNLNSVWAAFDAYENQIAELQLGQKIQMTTSAFPNREFEGTVSFIDPILNTATRTVTVRATLQNKDDLLKPGMFVTVVIAGTAPITGQITIPATAVLWTGERSLVYVKTHANQPIFEMREVILGSRQADSYPILSGLQNGDEIVTNGTFTVDATAQLQGKRSMMNQQVTHSGSTTFDPLDMKFPKAFGTKFRAALKPYLRMKDAFVLGNTREISASAEETANILQSAVGEDLGKLESQHVRQAINMLSAISENTALENQRAHFVMLNKNMVPIAMNLEGLSDYYVQTCPMANNDKGATWISAQREIKNPYYGDAMLTCGSVTAELD